MSLDSDNPVLLESCPTEIQASFITSALTDDGIEFETIGELTAQNRCEGPGWVRILVRQCDLKRAQETVTQLRAAAADIDWSQVDVGVKESTETSEIRHRWFVPSICAAIILYVILSIAIYIIYR